MRKSFRWWQLNWINNKGVSADRWRKWTHSVYTNIPPRVLDDDGEDEDDDGDDDDDDDDDDDVVL